MGDLVDPNQVGQVLPDRREEIIRAAGLNDYGRVCELLADSAKEMRTHLYFEAQRLLQYREPPIPSAQNERTRNSMRASQRLVRTKDRASIERALVEFQQAWQLEIDNLEIQNWVAFLEAKTGNLQAAEQKLEQLHTRRGPTKNLVTDWNLAVLRYEQKNEPGAYQLLVPLLDNHSTDEDLILVVLALSLKLDDRARFLSTVPQTMSIRYHPLALIIAHEMKNSQRVTDLMAQLSAQWRGKWELPSVEQRFGRLEEMRAQVVNKAIVEGQTEQLISWLEKRIRLNRNWAPDYIALAEVLEKWRQDVDGAFRVLRSRLDAERKRSARQKENDDPLKYQRTIDRASEDLLNLARRAKRADLGTQAYTLARSAGARQDLLHAFAHFAPADDTKPDRIDEVAEVRELPEAVPIPQARDPRLADRLMWINAGLTQIRNGQSYSEKSKEIEEFSRVAAEVSPHEAGEVLKLIGNITGVIETFLRTDPDKSEDRVARRTLYSRVSGYEKELAQLLKGGALSQQLAALITPYVQALQQVVGDMSRLAGVGPSLDLAVENPFISLESASTTLVVRVTDRSERPVTDVSIEMISETPYVSITGNRKRTIPRLELQRSELLSVPVERLGGDPKTTVSEITIAASLRASAEGYPDVGLGIKKLTVPVRTFDKALGVVQIPKLFQEAPLRPSAPELFQGRSLLLNSIKNSFYGGTQRERYFFDGIRRVGKTTILNFLPQYVPDNVIPVISNFETFGVRGRFSSASVLHRFSMLTAESAAVIHNVEIDVPNEPSFTSDPGRAFSTFLSQVSAALPGKIPLLVIDEFQELLQEIAATGLGGNRDTLVLDQLRGHLDTGRLYALFTGSVRFDRLSSIAEHRLFGSLTRLPVSFLPAESVGDVLRTGLQQWVKVPSETVSQVHQLTGGYPWLVQKYGLAIVDLLNSEHRTVVTPKDVEDITSEKVLWDDTLFEFWWPKDQLGPDEERFVEWMLRKYPQDQRISIRNFLADVGAREQPTFRRAFENLRAAEVLDSTQTEYLQFAGSVLRRWLENQISDGQLHIRRASEAGESGRGQAGIFIDHENLIKTLERIGESRGVDLPRPNDPSRVKWFSDILRKLMDVGESRVGRLEHRVAVSFWDRANEAKVSRAYQAFDFQLKAPEETGKGNEVDFKLADEARRARERAQREKSNLTRAIVVTGDSDLSALVRGLMNDGVSVQVWGGSRATGDMYISVVGPENFIYLDDICGI